LENAVTILDIIASHPKFFIMVISLVVCLLGVTIYLFFRNLKSVQLKDFHFDFTEKESVKEDALKNTKNLIEAKKRVEENTRHIITRQFNLVHPFLQSLRPIFNRLMYSIMEEAITSSFNFKLEERTTEKKEKIPGMGDNSYYLIEKVKTYHHDFETRTFTNLVESSVDSLLADLETEIFKMLVTNNIGKTREEVQLYVKSRNEFIVGIIRNNLCDAYNNLSNKNLFDTKRFWAETGISYPEDWISDQIYKLLKSCMEVRYSDFQG
jgi:hypothetical protein